MYLAGVHVGRVAASERAGPHEQALVSLKIKETVDAEGWCTKGRYLGRRLNG